MRKISFFILLLLGLTCCKQAYDEKNPYGLDMTCSIHEYQQEIARDSNMQLVNIEEMIDSVIMDIRYATSNNFTGEIVYQSPRAFLRLPAARALAEVQDDLKLLGYGLVIYDAYRPYRATLRFYEVYPDLDFVADPKKGSRHNRGCAVDVGLYDLKTGAYSEMPSAFDEFNEKSHPKYKGAGFKAMHNREILINTMAKNGFLVYSTEWWHFDYKDWYKYFLMNLDFEEIEKDFDKE